MALYVRNPLWPQNSVGFQIWRFSKQAAEGIRKGWSSDELENVLRNFVRPQLSGFNFAANRLDINLRKAFFQGGLTVEENFQVVRVLQISDQRRVRNHGLKEFADGVMPAFPASTAAEIAKEALHDVVGALRLD